MAQRIVTEGFESLTGQHPLELGEAALAAFFGYHLEGPIDPNLFDPEDVSLMCFKRSKPWWKLW